MRSTLFFLGLLFCSIPLLAKQVDYQLSIGYKTVQFSEKPAIGIAIDNQIPAPTITASVGDQLRVTFHNTLDVESSIHWHGVLLPNIQDGVPYLTTPPIQPGKSHTFEFPITHAGTYWYHSHTGFQEQRGVYGALVFHPQSPTHPIDTDHVLILSDWTDENPHQVMRNLKRDDDYYGLKKDSVQSWNRVIVHGKTAIKNRLLSSLFRMGPMDISDVGYDAFLSNGQKSGQLSVKNGDTVRLRLINASASSYQIVRFSGGPMTVISADGMDIKPIKRDTLKMAIAETYDVLISVPMGPGQYEFRATSEDGTGFSSTWLGKGNKIYAPDEPKLNVFTASHHDQSHNFYDDMSAVTSTQYPDHHPRREVVLRLTGNMETYVWSFNNRALRYADKIKINKGEIVRFKLVNHTMMHHPVHLHGHFFRVLNQAGAYSPLKHTVNVPAMGEVEIEFAATEEKDWFFHCHNLYHMKAGMARVIRYVDHYEPERGARFDQFVRDHLDPWYSFGDVALQSSHFSGKAWAETIYYEVEGGWEFDYSDDYEIDLAFRRRLSPFLKIFIGGDIENTAEESLETKPVFGLNYVLPFLIESEVRLDSSGDFRLVLESEIQLTPRLAFEWMWNTDSEYHMEGLYEITKTWGLLGSYDSDFGWGGGIKIGF